MSDSGRAVPARARAPAAPVPPRRGTTCGTRGWRRARADPGGHAPGRRGRAPAAPASKPLNGGRRSGTRPRSADSRRPSVSSRSSFVETGSGASRTRPAIASSAGVCAWRRSAVKIGVRIVRPTTTPACRAAIVHPREAPVESGRAALPRSASRPRAQGRGRRAPAARSSRRALHRAGARARSGHRRSGPIQRPPPTESGATPQNTGPAATAATGTAVTATAATAGERPQPSTSNSTSRNSAAVSAADSSASARLASTCGWSGGRVERRPTPLHDPAAQRDRSREREQHDRDLHHEDRPPRECRGQEPSGHRTERRPGDTGRGPPPHARALDPGCRNEQLEASHDHQRTARRLRCPRRDQHPSDGATAHTVVADAKPMTPLAVATAGSPRTHRRAPGTATTASTRLNAIRTHATPRT